MAWLVLASVITGFLCAMMCNSLKNIAGHYEEVFFNAALSHRVLFILFPACGLFLIYALRQHLFKRKENKGIREIFATIREHHQELPAYKIPSHYVNGLLTVAFGGSTGVEVSTVVASAAVGSIARKKFSMLRAYQTELICAGVAAGITALFNSPLAGILFSVEVLTRKVSRPLMISSLVSVSTAWLFNMLLNEGALFSVGTITWHTYAVPYFILLGIIAGLNSVYLTKSVFFFKKQFARFRNNYVKVAAGSGAIGILLLLFPQLYGEGYDAVKELCRRPEHFVSSIPLLLTLSAIVLLKPLITSLTLASGGDGGVFAPSIFIGAFLGLIVSGVLNGFFHAEVIPINFMIIGMAAVLSSSIHAPFTAIFLTCGLIGSYALIIPIFIGCAISKLTSMMVFPYTVYSPPAK